MNGTGKSINFARMVKWLSFRLLLLGILGWQSLAAQVPPKREFRAVWVCTLANLDWPSRATSSPATQQREMIRMLDRFEEMGMNAIIFQVRPAGDAFYHSDLAPWSHYLTGQQGKAPSPYYDPLAFIIEACHERNIELHAWFNPFRAVSHTRHVKVSARHPSKLHPDWCFDYGDSRYYNPGVPAARDHIQQVILEVLRKYDVDGIHLDDYFYPYPIGTRPVPDDAAYARYGGPNYPSRAHWRRHNIDEFVRTLNDSIQEIKPWVKFGISPFGVWRNQTEDSRGSTTDGAFSAYEGLYSDTRKWIKEGWVDYMAPQIYWSVNHPRASYRIVLDWWNALEADRHIFVGHAPYLMSESSAPAWAKSSEFLLQTRLQREKAHVSGDIWFRAKPLMKNPQGFCDALRQQCYQYPALPPAIPWKDSIPPERPGNFRTIVLPEGVQLSWDPPRIAEDGQTAAYYVIYRFEGGERYDLSDPRNIVSVQRTTTFFDENTSPGNDYGYVVTAVDRSHNESKRFVYYQVHLIESPPVGNGAP